MGQVSHECGGAVAVVLSPFSQPSVGGVRWKVGWLHWLAAASPFVLRELLLGGKTV